MVKFYSNNATSIVLAGGSSEQQAFIAKVNRLATSIEGAKVQRSSSNGEVFLSWDRGANETRFPAGEVYIEKINEQQLNALVEELLKDDSGGGETQMDLFSK